MATHNAGALPHHPEAVYQKMPIIKDVHQQVPSHKSGEQLVNKQAIQIKNVVHIVPHNPELDLEDEMTCVIVKQPGNDSCQSALGQPSDGTSGDPQPGADSWQTVIEGPNDDKNKDNNENNDDDDNENAVSDKSFTPPRRLKHLVKIDRYGRRHVLPPRGCGTVAPPKEKKQPLMQQQQLKPQKTRFVTTDLLGQRHLMPPPGLPGVWFQPLNECRGEHSRPLTFERKRDFKEEFQTRQQETAGGIALAVAREKEARSEENKNKKERRCTFSVCQDPPKNTTSNTYKKRAKPRPQNQLIDGWESRTLKGIFDAEEDLLYNTRWPASTF
ncbi:hypothetical protein F4808DRAFT_472270 [Astrocystis sublimbata]|nr:hypothetical protein F4808DRAFT_472270 [Astrocystis sublimbata]